MKVEVIKILAYGSQKRFMTIIHQDKYTSMATTIRITDEVYKYLKAKGVPTAQKLRYNKNIKENESKQD